MDDREVEENVRPLGNVGSVGQLRPKTELPPPKCRLGYPREQVAEILGDRAAEFHRYMTGQTVGVCEGRLYNHETSEYQPTECADNPHGVVVYGVDIKAFLEGRPPLD